MEFERETNPNGTFAVNMRRDICFATSQEHTDPIDDLNVVRMGLYIQNKHDVKFSIVTGIQRSEACTLRGVLKAPVKTPATHGVTLQMARCGAVDELEGVLGA